MNYKLRGDQDWQSDQKPNIRLNVMQEGNLAASAKGLRIEHRQEHEGQPSHQGNNEDPPVQQLQPFSGQMSTAE